MILYVKLSLFPKNFMEDEFNVTVERHLIFNRYPQISKTAMKDLKDDGICVISVGKLYEEYVIDTINFKRDIDFISGPGDKEKVHAIKQIIRDYNISTLIE